jgi:hypothetical protein
VRETVDPNRFPTLAAYVDALPSGLHAYPDCRTKAALLRSALEERDLTAVLPDLPEPLRTVFAAPPAITDWVPAVIADAAFHVVCDVYYPTPEAMLAWTYERTIGMAQRPMYKSLVRAAGPALFLKIAGRVHGLFQKGTDLEVEIGDHDATLTLTNPAHLHSDLNRSSNVALCRAVLEMTGGVNPTCEITDQTPTRAIYRCRWT